MFKQIESEKTDCLIINVSGLVKADDYINVLKPSMDKALETNDKIRILFKFDEEFSGYEARAAFEDMKFGMNYLDQIDRIAIVTDKNWLSRSVSLFGSLIPCSVNSYKISDYDSAVAWLNSGELGIDFSFDYIQGNMMISLHDSLSTDNFSALEEVVDGYLKTNKELNSLLIKTKSFPGWENFGAFLEHISFIKNHHAKIKKVGFISDSKVPEFMAAVANQLMDTEVKSFAFEEEDTAKSWIA